MKTFEINDEIEQAFRQGREIGFRQGIEACKAEGFGIYRPNRNTLTITGKLPSLNEYIGACRTNAHVGAKMKRETEEMIIIQLGKLRTITSPVIIHFEWHEKTRRRDKDSVAAAKKFILDAMQQVGKLPNDNNSFIAGFTDRFTYGDDYGVTITVEAVDE